MTNGPDSRSWIDTLATSTSTPMWRLSEWLYAGGSMSLLIARAQIFLGFLEPAVGLEPTTC